MAVPLSYNWRSLKIRWLPSLVAVVGIAGAVAVFIALLALGQGLRATLVSSGSPDNALVRRSGATLEMDSTISDEQVHVIADLPEGVARAAHGALVSPEVVVTAALPLIRTGTDADVQLRGVSPLALEVRPWIKLAAGRFLTPGLTELVVGRNASRNYAGFELGHSVRFGGNTWTVVGVFDAGGTSFDSEIWADAGLLNQVYQRPPNTYQSVTVRLTSPAALDAFEDALRSDRRMTVQVDREAAYYEKQSRRMTRFIVLMGTIVGAIMGAGAVFGALNSMYAAVSERTREIATLRAIGFPEESVVASLLFEALCIGFVGGVAGCLVALPLDGVTTGTMNWQTYSQLAFGFRVTPQLLLAGLLFALAMGVIGGAPPALRAVRGSAAVALREL